MILPSKTSAETNIMRPEMTYCGTEYGTKIWKLRIMPIKTIISDAIKICLHADNLIKA